MIDKKKLLSKIVGNGYTQYSLAKVLGVSKNTLNAKINGKSSFDTDLIDKLCVELNITDDLEKAQIFLSTASQNRDENEV